MHLMFLHIKKITFALVLCWLLSFLFAKPTFAAGTFFQSVSSAFTATLYKIYFLFPGNKSGKIVFAHSLDAMQRVQSFQVTCLSLADLKSSGVTAASLKVLAQGPVRMESFFNPQSYTQALTVSADAMVQGKAFRFQAETRTVDKTFYLKWNELPMLPSLDLSTIKGGWLKFPQSTSFMAQPSVESQQKMTDAFTELIHDSQFSSAKKDMKNGHAVYVVSMTVPKAALSHYMTSVSPNSSSKMTQLLNNLGDINGTLWIDRDSFYIRHVELPVVYTLVKKSSDPTTLVNATDPFSSLRNIDSVKMTVLADFDSFNTPVQVDAPAQPQDALPAFRRALSFPAATDSTLQHYQPSELAPLSPSQRSLLQRYKTTPPLNYQYRPSPLPLQ